MKKIFSLALCMGAFLTASAQLIISPTGMMDEVGMQAEAMSPDASSFVAGSNQLSSQAAIWNVATDEVWEFGGADTIYAPIYGQKPGWEYIYDEENWWVIVDSVETMVDDYDNIIGYDSTLWDLNTYGGTFHAVNNNGLAVGSYGGAYTDHYPVKAQFGDADVTYLYCDTEVEAGGDAWAVNADGSIILGFYFDAAWVTKACLWVNGGLNAEDRIDLPAPTEEEFGGPIDYVSARWMSEDASVILGYAQDAYNGSWVMIYWTKNADNTYTVHSDYAKQNYTPYGFDDMTGDGMYLYPEKPYTRFEPQAISANGEWVSLVVKPQYDLNDWFAMQVNQTARLNLTTGNLEVLNLGEYDGPIMYGIANNGTAVGATEAGGVGPLAPKGESLSAERVGYVWFAGSDTIITLQELFPNEKYFNYEAGMGEAAISSISADATTICGYTNQTDGIETWVTSSFIVTLPATAIENIKTDGKTIKTIENGQLVIIRDNVRYNVMGSSL